jgi:hypothetical protein
MKTINSFKITRMKKYSFVLKRLIGIVPFIVFSACDENKEPLPDEDPPFFEITDSGDKSITFVNGKSSDTVSIKTDIPNWTFKVDGSGWCTVSKVTKGLRVEVSENLEISPREAKIFLTAGKIREKISVAQLGTDLVLIPKQKTAGFGAKGGTVNIEMTTNISDWTFSGGNEWCHPEKKNGSKLAITVDSYSGYMERTAAITLLSDKLPDTDISIKVTQAGIELIPMVEVSRKEFTVAKNANTIDFTITTNVNVTLTAPKWITVTPSTVAPGEKIEIRGVVAANDNTGEDEILLGRTGAISLTAAGYSMASANISVYQKGDWKITQIVLTESDLSTNAQEPVEGPVANLIDDDLTNFFHTKWSIKDIPMPHWLQVNLKEKITSGKFYFATRVGNDTNAHTPTDFDLLGNTTATETGWFLIKKFTLEEDGLPNQQGQEYTSKVFTASQEFQYIRISVNKSLNDRPHWNMAELKIYKAEKE